jgi:hypothetical protein
LFKKGFDNFWFCIVFNIFIYEVFLEHMCDESDSYITKFWYFHMGFVGSIDFAKIACMVVHYNIHLCAWILPRSLYGHCFEVIYFW